MTLQNYFLNSAILSSKCLEQQMLNDKKSLKLVKRSAVAKKHLPEPC
jgi:hypothetical protein